jgi:hypothetical protein
MFRLGLGPSSGMSIQTLQRKIYMCAACFGLYLGHPVACQYTNPTKEDMCAACFALYFGHLQACHYKNLTKCISDFCNARLRKA